LEREQVNLAAIMFTDIVGYTSLTESDEKLALKLLGKHREIIRPLISAHNGKEVKTMGDAFLVEFTSAAEATRCAIEIQEALYSFNLRSKPKERISVRIGIHLGDVIHANNDVYGDAVNIASRIEAICEAGGISVSRQVYDSVRNKLRDISFESLGLKQMKNVENGLEVFKIQPSWAENARDSFDAHGEDSQPRNRVAVLPFVNIGPDPSDEFFADGLTEELISRLSQAKDLRVIARTSAMNYKNDRQKKVKDIGRELGAGTIVEGSVRKAGTKVRVTVQVVNAKNEEHLWASTYDRNLDDIFEIQTDIATKVADSFSSNLTSLMQKQIRASHAKEVIDDVNAYTYFLRGRYLLHGETESSVRQALEFFNKAIAQDPTFARAYVARSESSLSLTMFASIGFVEGAKKAEADARKALEIDPDLAEAHAILSQAKYALDEFTEAEQEARKAIELNPSLADAYHALGHLKWIRGHLSESLELYETAYKLDPLKEENIRMLSEIYLQQGRDEDFLRLWSPVENFFPQSFYASMTIYYLYKHKYEKATEFLEKFKLAGSDPIFVFSFEGLVAAHKGEKEKALEMIKKIEQTSVKDTGIATPIGFIYYALGDLDKFFEYMNRAMDNHALPLGDLVNSSVYANARKDPRFRKLLERLDLKIDLPLEKDA
jgi:adenylate cyclase